MNSPRLLPAYLLVLLAFAATHVLGQSNRQGIPLRWPVGEFPDPHSQVQDEQRFCGRYNVSSVCDPNGIITRTDADAIDSLINAVYRETTCQCYQCLQNNHGYTIRVAIMPEMERVFPEGENTTYGRLRDAQMYAYILTQRWRMEGACNETLLILYARDDGILYTLTRQNTKLKLSDDDVKRVLMMVRHYFDDQNTIADGIMEMIRRYKLIFEGKHDQAFEPVGRGQRG